MSQKMKLAVTIVAAVAIAFGLFKIVKNLYLSDEDRISNRISDAVAAAENNDTGGVVSILAQDFAYEDGMNRNDFKMFIFGQFRVYSVTKIETLEKKVEVNRQDKTAVVTYKGKLTATENASKQAMGDTLSLKLHFKKYEKEGWLINRVEEDKTAKK